MARTDFEGLTVKELRQLARQIGIGGYSRMKREELVEAVRAVQTDRALRPQVRRNRRRW